MAQQAIPEAEFNQLDAACSDFDQQTVGTGKIQELKDLADQLVREFPPDPDKMAAASACAGCCGPH